MKYYRLSIHRVLTKQKKETKKILGFIPVSYTKVYEEPITIMTDIILYDDQVLSSYHAKSLIDLAIDNYLIEMKISPEEHRRPEDPRYGYDNIQFDHNEILFEEIDPLLIFDSNQLNIWNQINTWGEELICPLYSPNTKSIDFLKSGESFDFVTGANIDPNDSRVILWTEESEIYEDSYYVKSKIRNGFFDRYDPRSLLSHISIDDKIIERIKMYG